MPVLPAMIMKSGKPDGFITLATLALVCATLMRVVRAEEICIQTRINTAGEWESRPVMLVPLFSLDPTHVISFEHHYTVEDLEVCVAHGGMYEARLDTACHDQALAHVWLPCCGLLIGEFVRVHVDNRGNVFWISPDLEHYEECWNMDLAGARPPETLLLRISIDMQRDYEPVWLMYENDVVVEEVDRTVSTHEKSLDPENAPILDRAIGVLSRYWLIFAILLAVLIFNLATSR